jgi:hypothetical protein
MKKLALASTVVLVAFASYASAEETRNCGNAPQDKWMSKETFTDKMKAQGIEVRRIKIEGSCYEVYGIDAKGAKIERLFNPETGIVVGDEEGED